MYERIEIHCMHSYLCLHITYAYVFGVYVTGNIRNHAICKMRRQIGKLRFNKTTKNYAKE